MPRVFGGFECQNLRNSYGNRAATTLDSPWLFILIGMTPAHASEIAQPPPHASAANSRSVTRADSQTAPEPGLVPGTPAPIPSGAPKDLTLPPGSNVMDQLMPGASITSTSADPIVAVDQAKAAYAFGDIPLMIESSRQVAEGPVDTPVELRLKALELLGIGLALTERDSGARTAFQQLLKLDPTAKLNPATTRPKIVASFEQQKRQHIAALVAKNRRERPFWLSFFPPLGQFQNGDNARGWTILSLGTAALGTAITTNVLANRWAGPDQTWSGHESAERPTRIANAVSVGVLAGAFLWGVIDAAIRYPDALTR